MNKLLFLILPALLSASAQAQELGRLFFSPAERKQIEQQHAQQALKNRLAESSKDGDQQSAITVNGLIKRSDGSRIVWINGKQQRIAPGRDPNKIPVTVPGQNQTVDVKVGQRLLLDNPAPKKNAAPAEEDD